MSLSSFLVLASVPFLAACAANAAAHSAAYSSSVRAGLIFSLAAFFHSRAVVISIVSKFARPLEALRFREGKGRLDCRPDPKSIRNRSEIAISPCHAPHVALRRVEDQHEQAGQRLERFGLLRDVVMPIIDPPDALNGVA